MIIDAHTHIFPESVRNNRSEFFKGEPAFELLYASPKSKMVGASELVKTMDVEGVDVSVVFGFPWNDAGKFHMHNLYVMEAVKTFPDRLIGFCCLDPFHESAVNEVSDCIDGGLKGVGELAFYRSGIDESCLSALAPIMEIAEASGLPVMIHTNEPVGHIYPGKAPMTLKEIYDLCGRFSDNKIILAHWGGGIFFYNLLKKEVKDRLKNIYYDSAASPYLYEPGIYPAAIAHAGGDKVLFGSDYPLLKPSRYFKDIQSSGLSHSQISAVCGDNAAVILGFS